MSERLEGGIHEISHLIGHIKPCRGDDEERLALLTLIVKSGRYVGKIDLLSLLQTFDDDICKLTAVKIANAKKGLIPP